MASIPTLQTRDLFAARLQELAAKLRVEKPGDVPSPYAINLVRNELVRLAQG